MLALAERQAGRVQGARVAPAEQVRAMSPLALAQVAGAMIATLQLIAATKKRARAQAVQSLVVLVVSKRAPVVNRPAQAATRTRARALREARPLAAVERRTAVQAVSRPSLPG
jgi:glycerol uptake facilitator-like aquaporin